MVSNNHTDEPTHTLNSSRKTSSTTVLVSTFSSQLHFHARLLNSPGISYKDKESGCCSSMEFPFYHGNITRKTCEELLSKKGKDGSFLLRDSESMTGALCLCVFFKQLIYTYRIFRECEGYFRIQTSEDTPKQVFKTINDLIYTYEKPNQGLVINLRYPVRRLKSSRKSSVEMDKVYDEIEDRDYVDVLP
ncbi:SH2 domain-containing protein 1B [Dermochelys coriacea]|uniref:SH2 domain-containing protein 1B n=1 Tax=Dermochelys coriacea TaxID=27794 RepID=UPI001CA8E0C6|nr:SH2 domain-containing protein 1B [Dermochelys coriacea]